MKSDWDHLEQFRYFGTPRLTAHRTGDHFGAFFIPFGGTRLRCVVDDGRDPGLSGEEHGWEHVSVSASDPKKIRTPTWSEMCFIKDKFWDEDETVIQFHPPRADYVNNHPHTLHLWRHMERVFPAPPSILVGIKSSP